jgi:hypothetical protein
MASLSDLVAHGGLAYVFSSSVRFCGFLICLCGPSLGGVSFQVGGYEEEWPRAAVRPGTGNESQEKGPRTQQV